MSLHSSFLYLCPWLGLVFLLQVLPNTCPFAITVPKKEPKPDDLSILRFSNATQGTDCFTACHATPECRKSAWVNNTCFLITCSNASNCTDVSVDNLLAQIGAEDLNHDGNISEPHASVSPPLTKLDQSQQPRVPSLSPSSPSATVAANMSAVTSATIATVTAAVMTPPEKPSLNATPLFTKMTKPTTTSTTTTTTLTTTTTTTTTSSTVMTTPQKMSPPLLSRATTPPPESTAIYITTAVAATTTNPTVMTTLQKTSPPYHETTQPPSESTITTTTATTTTTTTTTTIIGNNNTPTTATTTTNATIPVVISMTTTAPPTTSTTTIATTRSSTSGGHDNKPVAVGTGVAVLEVTREAFGSQLVDTASLLSVLLFGMLFFLVTVAVFVTQAYESYRRKDYTQVDYLINGMYTDSGV